MRLCKETLSSSGVFSNIKPSDSLFELPEKVLQFGTGVLLRGLPDYFIDKANKQGLFNGRVVVIKSTAAGESDAFDLQDGLYTQCIRGYQQDKLVDKYVINASVSRVLSAKIAWGVVLECAANPQMELVISNTTEVGIVLKDDENIFGEPPASFPGKLLAFLYRRFQVFNGDASKGMVIVPTELVTGNGDLLRKIVLDLATRNNLEHAFIKWLQEENIFCNSLVDRIVPGKLPAKELEEVQQKLGYTDDLMIMSEVYSLWAIETNSQRAKDVLSFAAADSGVIITGNIEKYRELKLRLLNGTHSFSCGVAFQAGFSTVKEAMASSQFYPFISKLMMEELVPCIVDNNISKEEAIAFGESVLARFKNPFLDHRWISITLNYTQKMSMRNVPMLLKHYQHSQAVPQKMAFGFAAYLLFMNGKPAEGGGFEGEFNGQPYPIQDEKAGYFYQAWQNKEVKAVVPAVLSDTALWGHDLSALPGFSEAVVNFINLVNEKGMIAAITM